VLLQLDFLWILVLGLLLVFASTVDNSGNHALEVDFLQAQDFCVRAIFLLVQLAGKCLGNKFPRQAGLSILVMIGSHHPGNDSVIVLNTKWFVVMSPLHKVREMKACLYVWFSCEISCMKTWRWFCTEYYEKN
jgi:hypothetical protein